MKKTVWLMCPALAGLLILDAGVAEARRGRPRRPAPRPAPRATSSPKDMLLVVQLVPPKPPKKGVAVPPPSGYSHYSRYSATRSSTTVYLRSTPGGSAVTALPVGVEVRVLKKGKTHTRVETGGRIRVSGYVPNIVLGLRVQN
jgi:hypothetical protein